MKKFPAAVTVLVLIAMTGCTSTPTATPTATLTAASAFPVTVTNGGTDVTFARQPTAIVSLSPTATEMLFAISAGDQVVAVDDQSTYPAAAPHSDLSGFTPNVEAILAKHPDLVVVSNDIDEIVAALHTAQVPVLVEPAATTIADTYAQIEQLGQVTGHAQPAATLVATMKQRIAAAIASAPTAPGTTVYHELDNTMYSATSATFIGAVYRDFGLMNIADAAPDAASGYPQLSAEWIVKQDPRLVFLADTKCCAQDAASFAARPGFASLTAVTHKNVVALDDDIASRWGPRTADLYESVAAAVAQVK